MAPFPRLSADAIPRSQENAEPGVGCVACITGGGPVKDRLQDLTMWVPTDRPAGE